MCVPLTLMFQAANKALQRQFYKNNNLRNTKHPFGLKEQQGRMLLKVMGE
jgi:hypothetical protein